MIWGQWYRDDIFISYSRRDASLYAAGLADELTKRSFSCFIDQLGTDPDKNLPEEPLDLNSFDFAIVIQCVDAYMWAITTQNAQLVEAIKSKFKNAEVVGKTQRYH